MAARKEFPVKVRRVAVTNKKTGVKYIEERRYQYDPAKGYNVLLSSFCRAVGRVKKSWKAKR